MIRLLAAEATAEIDPLDGGRLTSLAVWGHEFLLAPRGDLDVVPTAGSFLMAPWVGELSHGQLDFRGESHQLPKNVGGHAVHGLVMRGPWDMIDRSERTAVLTRSLDHLWPFGGTVRQDFELDPAGLRQTVTIQAADRAMPVSAGWHPWFRRATNGPTFVRVEASDQLELDEARLPTGRVRSVEGETDLRSGPILGDRRIDEAFVDVIGPTEVVAEEATLRITFDPLISTVVVYTPPEAVCVEPWSAWPDSIRLDALGLDAGVAVLEPGETFRRWTYWSWRDELTDVAKAEIQESSVKRRPGPHSAADGVADRKR